MIYQTQCPRSGKGGDFTLDVLIDGVPIGIGGSYESVYHACATNNQQYFNLYRSQILVLKTSENVKLALVRACFGGTTLIATEDNGGIHVTGYGVPSGQGDGHDA